MSVTEYVWDPVSDNVLTESDAGGETTAEYTNEPDEFGQLISQRRDNATSTYHFDGQQSTRQLTDVSETVTDAATYSAFGNNVESSGATVNPFGFQGSIGYYANPSTNNRYVRARQYQPLNGRWESLDPLGFTDGVNGYVYSHNSPLNLSDPSGLVSCLDPEDLGGITFTMPKGYYADRLDPRVKAQARVCTRVVPRCQLCNTASTTCPHTLDLLDLAVYQLTDFTVAFECVVIWNSRFRVDRGVLGHEVFHCKYLRDKIKKFPASLQQLVCRKHGGCKLNYCGDKLAFNLAVTIATVIKAIPGHADDPMFPAGEGIPAPFGGQPYPQFFPAGFQFLGRPPANKDPLRVCEQPKYH